MRLNVGAQTAQGIGSMLGQLFAGGGAKGKANYDKGLLTGAQIKTTNAQARDRNANAQLKEDKAGYIAQALEEAAAGNWAMANANSLYGGNGNTGFQVTNTGGVFNKLSGDLDEGGRLAKAFIGAKQAQGAQYASAAGLNNTKSQRLAALLPFEQSEKMAAANTRQAQGQQYLSAAGLNNAKSQRMAALLPSEQFKNMAAGQARQAQGQQYLSAANFNNAKAGKVGAMLPFEQQSMLAQALSRQAQGQNFLSASELNAAKTAAYPYVQNSIIAKNMRTGEAQGNQPSFYDKEQYKHLAKRKELILEALQSPQQYLQQNPERSEGFLGVGGNEETYDAQVAKQAQLQGELRAIDQQMQVLSGGQNYLPSSSSPLLDQARQAIAAGADPAAVKARLAQHGVNAEGL